MIIGQFTKYLTCQNIYLYGSFVYSTVFNASTYLLRNHIIFNILDITMSNKAVEELENILCHNAKDYLIHEWIDKCFLDKSPKFLSYFFRKCSEQFLAYQDGKCSSIIHGLVKSHMSSSNKIKSLKMLLIRGVNCNKLDGNKKSILDHLVEDNDWECIKILLDYGQNLMVSENCLCRVFKLRNKHEEIFRALFAYAIKHKVAPNRTGISDGDTFLHEIMVHEKEIAHFKKWMGFFLSFPEININALNNDGLTIFDLLLLSYKKKKFKCAIKLLIKYNIDCIQPQLFSFKSQIKKEICNYISKQDFFSISVLKNENLELNTSNTELSIISSGKGFSHNYLKLNQIPLWSSTNSSQTLKKSLNDSVNLVNIPNYEETEITFEVEIFDKIPQRSKPKQTHLPKLAKAKKYLSSKEAIVLIKEDNHKALPCQSKMTAESNKGGYMEETKTDSVSNSTSTQQLLQELSANERTVSIYKLKHKLLHHYRKLGQGSYGTSNDTNHDGNPCVFPVTAGTKKSSKEIFGLLLTSLNHSTKEQFLGINYCRNTPPLPMETKQLNRYKCHKVNFSLTPYPLQNKILINIANKLNNLKFLKIVGEIGDCASLGWAHGNLGNAMLGLDQKEKALDHLITAFHMSARYEGNPLAVGRAVSNLGNAYQAMGCLSKAKKHYEIVPGHAIYGNDLQGQGRACGNIGNIYMLLKEPVKAVHYYRETLRLSTDKNTKITGHHNRGCARFDVAECIIQGKKPKELVPATIPGSEYGRLAIKLTDEVTTTDPVQETNSNREPLAQSFYEQKESSMSQEGLPMAVYEKANEGKSNEETVQAVEALPFLKAAKSDLLVAIESHEQNVQNVKGSHEALSLSSSLFESNSRSFYKMQETLVELGKLYQRLSRLGLMDMAAADPQEFKEASVYGEQARARTLGELVLQKKKTTYSNLLSISTPLAIPNIYKTVMRTTEIIGAKQQGFQVCGKKFHAQILIQLKKITMCTDLCSITTPLKVLNINRTVLAQPQKALISYKLLSWTPFPVKEKIAIKYHLIEFKKLQAILKNYCFYYACALSKPKAKVTVNHVYHSFNIEVVIKYMCVSTNTTANYGFKGTIELRNDNIIPQLSIKNAYFSSDITSWSHACVIDETILQVSQRRASAVTRGIGNESSSDDKGNSDSNGGNGNSMLCYCAHYTTSIPPILTDTLLNINKRLPSTTSYQRLETSFGLRIGTNVDWQQQTPSIQSLDCSNPISIIKKAALLLTAGDYGATIKVLEILDKHLLLLDEVDMAKEFGQGLANFKNLHYRAAKPCFTELFEKATNHHSTGDQALASIYLGEIEMSWAKYKDAVKHFTIAVTNYSTDNVAEKFQQTILSKSAVLVKKGDCHRSLSQIKEAINAFKLAKEVAELRQEQAVGSKLKTAKEDELSAICALGDILQSIGDYEQSFEHYEKSLRLAVELGDHVSIGWAHGNLGNAMLGLDQKDKALDHLITAFHMSARYEGNPLAVGRAVSNLGNAYQAIGNLPKAKEHYEIALGHAIYGNDLQGQGHACSNIGNIYMLLKEPVKAVHYYTETLRLSTDKNTKITGHHKRGCVRFDIAQCIIQGKKPKELVPATTPESEYGRLAIKRTGGVITDPVQETNSNREPLAQSFYEQKESSMSQEGLPMAVYEKANEGKSNEETVQAVEALPFLKAAKSDLLVAIESHEQNVQNIKGSHEDLRLSLSLFENNSQSFYKMQETLVELGRLYQQLSRLGLMDMAATDPQEFKDALVYGEQARARTLGEVVLQKKKASYSDLFLISIPLTIQDIYKTVKLQNFPVVFLSYCVSKLLMWILVKEKDEVVMRCQSVELKEEDLENGSFELYIRYNLLQFVYKHIFRQCSYEKDSPFTVLHDVIAIKIIEGLRSVGFSDVKEFIVIPDSVTHLLPFSPLLNKRNWQFFGDKYRIRIVPSFLSLLVMSMTSNPVVEIPGDKSDFLIVGNPTIPPFMYDSTQWNLDQLPGAEKEAISVANIIGTIPVLREQATKQSVLYRLRSAKVIHLATHGSAKGFLAFSSSFPLAEKEHILIFAKEIETLNISPALVVLSSCDSARGQVKAEGVTGMARAFLSAGAHSVLVSLWRVPDESANVFMNFFYQFLVNGLPSLQALQRSMQCLRCFLKYSHYVHWSGFQIIGKEVSFHKNSTTQFPIQKLLGEVSIFPRQQVKIIEENLLGVKNKIFTDIQVCNI